MGTIIETKSESVVSSHYIQYTKILQMTAYELKDMIREELNENPLLEFPDDHLELQEPFQGESYLEYSDDGEYEKTGGKKEEWDAYYGSVGLHGRDERLSDYLIPQLKIKDPDVRNAAVYIIHVLDDDGWLKESVNDIAAVLKLSDETVKKAVEVVQGLEPAGVGARNLVECLKLQLLRYTGSDRELCFQIVENYLPELGEKRYAAIAKKLSAHKRDIEASAVVIRSLNPRPGREFESPPKTRYVVPDLMIKSDGESIEISLVRGVIPEIRLNQEYVLILKTSKDEASRAYMNEYLPRARKLNDFVNMRNTTLIKIAGAIVSWQHDFFAGESGEIVPMTLTDIAAMENMHETTVSRAVNGKYVMTEKGVYALGDFFSRPVSVLQDGEQLSAIQIQKLIKEVQKEYTGNKHLSDQKISDILKQQGISIARRTVAKYRKKMLS